MNMNTQEQASTELTTEQQQRFTDCKQCIELEEIEAFVKWYTWETLNTMNARGAFRESKSFHDVKRLLDNESTPILVVVARRLSEEATKSPAMNKLLDRLNRDETVKSWYLEAEITKMPVTAAQPTPKTSVLNLEFRVVPLAEPKYTASELVEQLKAAWPLAAHNDWGTHTITGFLKIIGIERMYVYHENRLTYLYAVRIDPL